MPVYTFTPLLTQSLNPFVYTPGDMGCVKELRINSNSL